MKFAYTVKHNGVYYQPGEDVPMDEKSTEKEVVTDEVATSTSKRGRKKKEEE